MAVARERWRLPLTACAIACFILAGSMALSKTASRDVYGTVIATTGAQKVGIASLARCLWVLDSSHMQGILGFVIPLRPQESDGRHAFLLKAKGTGAVPTFRGAEASGDLRVAFFRDAGTCRTGSSFGEDLYTEYQSHEGMIPARSRYAVVILFSDNAAGGNYAGPPAGPLWVEPSSAVAQAFRFSIRSLID